MFGLPWWIYLMIIFMFFSGYMAFRAIRAEKQLEQQYIEREGSVFMERIAHEKQIRHGENDTNESQTEHIEEEKLAIDTNSIAENEKSIHEEEADTEQKQQVSV